MATGALAGLRVVSFEARREAELATLLTRHGAEVIRAPALREAPLPTSPQAHELGRHLEAGTVAVVILTTGVGTRALARALAEVCPRFAELLARTAVVARGPKPLAALRELGVASAHPVRGPFTWREVLGVVDSLGTPAGGLVAVQEYGIPVPALAEGLAQRGHRVLMVPVYRWALPDDPRALVEAARAITRGDVEVALFTNAAQVEHLFRIGDADVARGALARMVVASVGPVTSEALEAHGVAPDLEASPPKMGPLVALVAARAREILAAKRGVA
jgi:uroporphyrinogen-III synthase